MRALLLTIMLWCATYSHAQAAMPAALSDYLRHAHAELLNARLDYSASPPREYDHRTGKGIYEGAMAAAVNGPQRAAIVRHYRKLQACIPKMRPEPFEQTFDRSYRQREDECKERLAEAAADVEAAEYESGPRD